MKSHPIEVWNLKNREIRKKNPPQNTPGYFKMADAVDGVLLDASKTNNRDWGTTRMGGVFGNFGSPATASPSPAAAATGTAADWRKEGYSAHYLNKKFNTAQNQNFPLTELKAAGYPCKELYMFKAAELKEVGFSAGEIKNSGNKHFTLGHLQRAGFTAKEVRKGCPNELKREYIKAGYSKQEVDEAFGNGVDKTATELRDAGYNQGEIDQAFANRVVTVRKTASQLRSEGVPARKVCKMGYTLPEIREGGYTGRELWEEDFTLREIKDAGYPVTEVPHVWLPEEFRDVGYGARELKEKGYGILWLQQAGFKLPELKEAGFPMQELRRYYSPNTLKNTPEEMARCGFGLEFIRKHYTTEEIIDGLKDVPEPIGMEDRPDFKPSW